MCLIKRLECVKTRLHYVQQVLQPTGNEVETKVILDILTPSILDEEPLLY